MKPKALRGFGFYVFELLEIVYFILLLEFNRPLR
jgi:hypothetical protein